MHCAQAEAARRASIGGGGGVCPHSHSIPACLVHPAPTPTPIIHGCSCPLAYLEG